jgi:hypothetical protein
MRLLRTPLLHFALGGGVLFWLAHGAALLGTERRPPSPLVVSQADVTRLRLDYARESGVEPSDADESALIEKSIDEELLFREAMARGLDRHDRSVRNWLVEQMRGLGEGGSDDPDRLYAEARALGLDQTDLVVRRILVQKMRLLAARSGERSPSEDELRAFYEARRDEYRPPARTTFWQVFVASSAPGATPAARAETLLATLRGSSLPPGAAARSGDAFAVPPHLVAQSPAQLEKVFGGEFASALERAETERWTGPIASPYGSHLVWIEARDPGEPPQFDEVRSRVLERWYEEDRTRRVALLLHELRARTPLQIDSSAWRQRRAS